MNKGWSRGRGWGRSRFRGGDGVGAGVGSVLVWAEAELRAEVLAFWFLQNLTSHAFHLRGVEARWPSRAERGPRARSAAARTTRPARACWWCSAPRQHRDACLCGACCPRVRGTRASRCERPGKLCLQARARLHVRTKTMTKLLETKVI